jgi:GT2 family glycosyltransferase
VGPFREGLRRHQDWEWEQRLLRAGGRIVHVPDAWLWHRRGRSDLRVTRLAREFFLRGYTKATLGFPIDRRRVATRAAESLGHALRARCTRGLTEAARDAGLLWGALIHRRSG